VLVILLQCEPFNSCELVIICTVLALKLLYIVMNLVNLNVYEVHGIGRVMTMVAV
jgi:hypothetical protein